MSILTARCVWLHACLTRQPTNQDNNGVGRILNVFCRGQKIAKCVSWQSTPRKQIDWHVSINQACMVTHLFIVSQKIYHQLNYA